MCLPWKSSCVHTPTCSLISFHFSDSATNDDVKQKTTHSLCSTTPLQPHMTIAQLVQQTMCEMKRNAVLDHIVTQALQEDIDPLSVDYLTPEGKN